MAKSKKLDRQFEIIAAENERKATWKNNFLETMFKLMKSAERYPEFVSYSVLETSDENEFCVRFTFTREEYIFLSNDPQEWEVTMVQEKFEDYERKLEEERRKLEVRKIALTKLTAEEREVLGL